MNQKDIKNMNDNEDLDDNHLVVYSGAIVLATTWTIKFIENVRFKV